MNQNRVRNRVQTRFVAEKDEKPRSPRDISSTKDAIQQIDGKFEFG